MSHILYLRNRSHTKRLVLKTKQGVVTEIAGYGREQADLPCVLATLDNENINFDFEKLKSDLIEYLDDHYSEYEALPMDFSYTIEQGVDGEETELVFEYEHFISFLSVEEFKKYLGED